jgi:hypothetical protein
LNEKQFSLPHVSFELLQGALRKFAKSHNKRPGTGFLQMLSDPHTMFTHSNMCVNFPRVFLPLMLKPQESLNPNGKRCYISNCDNMNSSTSIIVSSNGRVLQN